MTPIRIAVWYDGNYFYHVSNFYINHHQRRRRLSFGGIHEFVCHRVAEEEGIDPGLCQVVDSRYFRARTGARNRERGGYQFYDRSFSDSLANEYVQFMHLPIRHGGGKIEEKGVEVLLTVEAMSLAVRNDIDVFVFVASDGSFVPLIRKLPAFGIRTMVLSWNFEWEDEHGRRNVTRSAQDLLNCSTYPVYLSDIIDDPTEEEEELVENMFAPFDTRTDTNRAGGEEREDANRVIEYQDSEDPQVSKIMSLKNGFGFITWPDNNLFFYHGDVEGVEFKDLQVGDVVMFTISKNERGENIAKRVSLPDGINEGGGDDDDLDDDDYDEDDDFD